MRVEHGSDTVTNERRMPAGYFTMATTTRPRNVRSVGHLRDRCPINKTTISRVAIITLVGSSVWRRTMLTTGIEKSGGRNAVSPWVVRKAVAKENGDVPSDSLETSSTTQSVALFSTARCSKACVERRVFRTRSISAHGKRSRTMSEARRYFGALSAKAERQQRARRMRESN